MKTLINKTASAVSTMALFAIGSVMALLGLSVVGVLAMFALFTVGLAFLAAPFVGMVQPTVEDAETVA